MKRLLLFITLTLLVATGCAQKLEGPTLSTASRLAIQGRQLITVANGAITAVDNLATNMVLTPPQAVTVFKVLEQVGISGQQLAAVLRIVDATTGADKVAAVTQAQTVLTSIRQVVTTLPLTGTAKTRVDAVTQPILEIVTVIVGMLQAGG